jgi:hypothetical protein
MKLTFRYGLPFLLLALGIWVGRASSDETPRQSDHTDRMAKPERHARTAGPAPGPRSPHDLKSLKGFMERNPDGDTVTANQLARLDSGTLKKMAEELAAMPAPQTALLGETGEIEILMSKIVRELYGREGLAMLEWADALGTDGRAAEILRLGIEHAAKDNFESAKPWIEHFGRLHGERNAYTLVAAGISGAKGHSAEELVRLYKMYGDHSAIRNVHLLKGGYGEDFDFGLFHREVGTRDQLSGLIRYWAMSDRDGAWDAMKESLSSNPEGDIRPFSSLLDGMVAAYGEKEAGRWLVSRLSELPQEKKDDYAETLSRLIRGGEAVQVAAAALPPDYRRSFVGAVVRNHPNPETVISALGTLPREDLVRALAENWNPQALSLPSTNSYEANVNMHRLTSQLETRGAELTGMMDHFQITPAERAHMMEIIRLRGEQ